MKRQRRWFSVTNFEKYQHYKDRSPKWIKLYLTLLDDNDFAALADDQKWHLVGIWLMAARIGNRLPYDPEFIGARIGASKYVNLDDLAKAGWLAVEADTVFYGTPQASVQIDTELAEHGAASVENRTLERETERQVTRDIGKSEKQNRAHSLPDDWSLTDDLAKAAAEARRENGMSPINVTLAATRFKNHWLGIASTARGRKTNWRRTWINWVLYEKGSGPSFDVAAAIKAAGEPDESI